MFQWLQRLMVRRLTYYEVNKELLKLMFTLNRTHWNSRAWVIAQRSGALKQDPDPESPLGTAGVGFTYEELWTVWVRPRYAREVLLPVAVDVSYHMARDPGPMDYVTLRNLDRDLQSYLGGAYQVHSRYDADPEPGTLINSITQVDSPTL